MTAMGMIDTHPALRAASPQASPADQFIGDDYHHYGAFRLMYAFDWLSSNARVRVSPTEVRTRPFEYGTEDGYRFFLELGPISNVNKQLFNSEIPTWNDFMDHGTYDEYWQSKNVLKDLHDIGPAVLNVVGWFDAEDYYGPLKMYYTIEGESPGTDNFLVAGPWSHGGWRSSGQSLGDIEFGSTTGQYFRDEIELPFLQRALASHFKLLPVMVREQSARVAQALGHSLARLFSDQGISDDCEALLVASTDLSHFYPQNVANTLDREMLRQVEAFDPAGVIRTEEDGKGFACGRGAMAAVLWAAQELGADQARVVRYATSGDVTGDYQRVVGYGAAVITRSQA